MLTPLVLLLVLSSSAVGVGAPVTPAQAQAPTPPRPLVVIGPTTVGIEHSGWTEPPEDILEWLNGVGGYVGHPGNPQPGDTLFVLELGRPSDPPPTWHLNNLPAPYDDWNTVKGTLEAASFSTAGFADIDASTLKIMTELWFINRLTGSEIDVIAHSQSAAVARAAIRNLEELDQDPGSDPTVVNPVHTMVSLGGQNYGASVSAPEWETGVVFLDILAENTLEHCRDVGWIEACPDMWRNEEITVIDPYELYDGDGSGDWDSPIWGPFDNEPLHASPFYGELNALDGVGPVPSTTEFHHLFSYVYEYDPPFTWLGDVEWLAGEVVPLFPAEPNVSNLSVQDFCADVGDSYPYVVNHNDDEWVDPAMRELVADALGLRTRNPAVC